VNSEVNAKQQKTLKNAQRPDDHQKQWCRIWGCKRIATVLICGKSGKNPWNFEQNSRKVGQTCFDTFIWDWKKYAWI